MKKIILALCLSFSATCFAINSYNLVAGTNSISIAGKRRPLNTVSLVISPDSVKCQFVLIYPQGSGMYALTPLDSAKHYKNNGSAFTTVSQIDSFYQSKFVK